MSPFRGTNPSVEASEPGMVHHTFDQDPENPHCYTWSEVYKNDAAFLAHLANPPVAEYLKSLFDIDNLTSCTNLLSK